MRLTRKESSTKLPIQRKGTKYIARALSDVSNSVPVVIAIRDMLKLAKTAKEVKKMIQEKLLKINGRVVTDYRESISLFNIFDADKAYELSLIPTKKFSFNPVKTKNQRLCKVVNKHIVKNGLIQLNFHDGSNILSKDNIKVGDSIYLDLDSKIKKHVSLEAGKDCFVISGKYLGENAKIISVKDKLVNIKLKEGEAEIPSNSVVVL